MSRDHPSGKPIRFPRRGIKQHIPWPREEMVVPRLNTIGRELVGGFGFRMTDEPEDPMWMETRAKQRR